MSNLRCKECKSTDVTAYTPGIFGDSRHRCNSCGKISVTSNFVEPTVFDRITQSPEVLADSSVYSVPDNSMQGEWWTSPFIDNEWCSSREEAYATTLKKLKEVEKDGK